MRHALLSALLFLLAPSVGAKAVKDTIYTRYNDKIIVAYDVVADGADGYVVKPLASAPPRIIPSQILKNECDGDLSRLKVVVFDRIGDFGKVRWNGLPPTAFTIPAGVHYDKSADGYNIFGESAPLAFTTASAAESYEIKLPLYIAVYERKHTYRIVAAGKQPLTVSLSRPVGGAVDAADRPATRTEQVAVHTSEELEGDNENVTRALSSMQMIRQLLVTETEFPFSQTLQMEIYNLRSLKDRISDRDVIERINEVMLQCNERERELKAAERDATLAAKAQAQALSEQQKQEEAKLQQEAEAKAQQKEEQQQKRTLWMIIGGVILGAVALIGNGVMKHFRDVSNRKSIMEMQESLTQQAAHEATRRSREIMRNKAHQAVNKGKTKLRKSMQDTSSKPKNKSNIKSI